MIWAKKRKLDSPRTEKSAEKTNFAKGVSRSSEIFSLEREWSRTVFENRRLSHSSENAPDKLDLLYVLSLSPSAQRTKSPNPSKLG